MSDQSALENIGTQFKSWADMVEEDEEDELHLSPDYVPPSPAMDKISPIPPVKPLSYVQAAQSPSQRQQRSSAATMTTTVNAKPDTSATPKTTVDDPPEWRRHDDFPPLGASIQTLPSKRDEWWEKEKPAPAKVDIDSLHTWRRPANAPPVPTSVPGRRQPERRFRRRSSGSSCSSTEGPRQSTVVYWHNSTEDDSTSSTPKTNHSELVNQTSTNTENRLPPVAKETKFAGDPMQRWHAYAQAEQKQSLLEEQMLKDKETATQNRDIKVDQKDAHVDTETPESTPHSVETTQVDVPIPTVTQSVSESVKPILNNATESDRISDAQPRQVKQTTQNDIPAPLTMNEEPSPAALTSSSASAESVSVFDNPSPVLDQTKDTDSSSSKQSRSQSEAALGWHSLDPSFSRPTPPKPPPVPVEDRSSSWQAFAQAHKKTAVPDAVSNPVTNSEWLERRLSPRPEQQPVLSATGSSHTAPALSKDEKAPLAEPPAEQPVQRPAESNVIPVELEEPPQWGPTIVPWSDSFISAQITSASQEQIEPPSTHDKAKQQPQFLQTSSVRHYPPNPSMKETPLKQPARADIAPRQPRQRPRIAMGAHFKLLEKTITQAANQPSK